MSSWRCPLRGLTRSLAATALAGTGSGQGGVARWGRAPALARVSRVAGRARGGGGGGTDMEERRCPALPCWHLSAGGDCKTTGGREGARSDGTSLGVVPSDEGPVLAPSCAPATPLFSSPFDGGCASLPCVHAHLDCHRPPPPLAATVTGKVMDRPPRAQGPRDEGGRLRSVTVPRRLSLGRGTHRRGGVWHSRRWGLSPLSKWMRLL